MKAGFPTLLLIVLLAVQSPGADALTMGQFSQICASVPGDCDDHPVIRAYVGGALDLLATLDEKTDYLAQVYCREPAEIFDVSAIIQFMNESDERYASENAMLVLLQYFQQHGGCET